MIDAKITAQPAALTGSVFRVMERAPACLTTQETNVMHAWKEGTEKDVKTNALKVAKTIDAATTMALVNVNMVFMDKSVMNAW